MLLFNSCNFQTCTNKPHTRVCVYMCVCVCVCVYINIVMTIPTAYNQLINGASITIQLSLFFSLIIAYAHSSILFTEIYMYRYIYRIDPNDIAIYPSIVQWKWLHWVMKWNDRDGINCNYCSTHTCTHLYTHTHTHIPTPTQTHLHAWLYKH